MASIPISAVLALAVVLVAGVYKYVIYPAFLSPLAKIPAARWHARFCPLWAHYVRWANIENETVYQLHKKYGKIVRMGPAELSVSCYEDGVKKIYTTFPKTDFYYHRFGVYGQRPLFTMTDKDDHAKRKRMMSHIYSKTVVLTSPTVREASRVLLFDRLLPMLQKSSDTRTPINIHLVNHAYAMDSFTLPQFGVALGSNFLQEEEGDTYHHHFHSRVPWLFWITEFPEFSMKLAKLLGIHLIPPHLFESLAWLEKWNLDLCDRAEQVLAEGKTSQDSDPKNYPMFFATLRNKFLETDGKAGYRDNQPYHRRLDIAADMFDHNAAAYETSANTMTWLWWELSRRRDLQDRLRAELMTLDPPISFPPDNNKDASAGQEQLPDFKALDSLPLMDAILQETMRCWIAVAGSQPRYTPQPVCSVAGYDNIPPGVRISAAAYTLHKNENVFPEPEVWKPERWLEATPEQLKEMKHYWWAFGSGRHACIGSNIATHSMKLAMAGIYTNYTTTIVDDEGIELVAAGNFTTCPRGNKLWLQFNHV